MPVILWHNDKIADNSTARQKRREKRRQTFPGVLKKRRKLPAPCLDGTFLSAGENAGVSYPGVFVTFTGTLETPVNVIFLVV